jgi:hypothetical protein
VGVSDRNIGSRWLDKADILHWCSSKDGGLRLDEALQLNGLKWSDISRLDVALEFDVLELFS